MWTEFQTSRELGTLLLLTVALSSTAIWLATGATSFLLRRGSAACRHRLWGLSMLGVMIAPIVILELPLPRWTISNRDFVAEWIPRALDPSFDPHPKHSAGRDPLSARSEEPIEECGIQPGCATTPVHSVIDVSGKSVLHVLTWVWYSGMLVSGFLFVRSIRCVGLLRNRALKIESGSHFEQFERLCRKLPGTRPVGIVMSPEMVVPCVAGFWRPVVLLPAGFGQWSSERLKVVLNHELMHVKRSDVGWQLIARLCLVPVWFHPLGWLAFRQLRTEGEHACDDAVLSTGESACEYANHLVELTKWSQRRAIRLPPQIVAIVGQNPVEQRIRSILDPSVARHPLSRWRASAAAIWIASIVLVLATVSPSQSESKVVIEPAKPAQLTQPVTETVGQDETISNEPSASQELASALEFQPAPAVVAPPPPPPDRFLELLDNAIETTSRRTLTAHSPWQIFHCILALRQNTVLRLQGQNVNAIQWLSSAEPQFDNQPWLLLTPHGAKFHPYTRMYAFEGHPAQFLALLSQSNLPLDHQFRVQGQIVTLNDLVNNTMKEVNTKEEVTWVLWALQHFLKSDAVWTNQWNESWSIERLVMLESQAPVVGAPCGGNHRLFALTRARDKYLASGGLMRGVWFQADQKIKQHLEIARSLQNSDGSFSSDFYKGPGYTTDINRRFNSTGHTMEFLSIALPKERLNEPWVRNAVWMLSRELVLHRDAKIDCGPLFHSLDALILYRDRLRQPPR